MHITNSKSNHFNDLFERHYKGLVTVARKIVGDSFVAEDIATDAFVKLWKRFEDLEHHSSIKGYLYITVYNDCILFNKRKIRAQKYSEEYSYLTGQSQLTEELERTTEMNFAIHKEMKQLKPVVRQVMTLYYFEELTIPEISSRLDMPINTVKSHKSRGESSMNRQLKYLTQ